MTAPLVGSCLQSLQTPGIGGRSAYNPRQQSGRAAGASIHSTTDDIRPVAAPSSHSPSPRRKRSIRRRITYPLHPEQRLMSSSAKVWLQAAPDRSLRATKSWSQQPAALRQALRHQPCPTEVQHWLERFRCQQCGEQRWWQIAFHPPSTYSMSLPEKQYRRGLQNGYGAYTRTPAHISSALAGARQ